MCLNKGNGALKSFHEVKMVMVRPGLRKGCARIGTNEARLRHE